MCKGQQMTSWLTLFNAKNQNMAWASATYLGRFHHGQFWRTQLSKGFKKKHFPCKTDYEQHLTLLAIITTLQTVLPKSISSGKIFDIHSCWHSSNFSCCFSTLNHKHLTTGKIFDITRIMKCTREFHKGKAFTWCRRHNIHHNKVSSQPGIRKQWKQ